MSMVTLCSWRSLFNNQRYELVNSCWEIRFPNCYCMIYLVIIMIFRYWEICDVWNLAGLLSYFYISWSMYQHNLFSIYNKGLPKTLKKKVNRAFLAIYCVQYPQAVPFLRNKIPYSVLKPSKPSIGGGPRFGKLRGKTIIVPFYWASLPVENKLLSLEIQQNCGTPWKFHAQKPRLMEIPHEYLLEHPWKFHFFFNWPLEFPHFLSSIPLEIPCLQPPTHPLPPSVCFFSGIAHCLSFFEKEEVCSFTFLEHVPT